MSTRGRRPTYVDMILEAISVLVADGGRAAAGAKERAIFQHIREMYDLPGDEPVVFRRVRAALEKAVAAKKVVRIDGWKPSFRLPGTREKQKKTAASRAPSTPRKSQISSKKEQPQQKKVATPNAVRTPQRTSYRQQPGTQISLTIKEKLLQEIVSPRALRATRRSCRILSVTDDENPISSTNRPKEEDKVRREILTKAIWTSDSPPPPAMILLSLESLETIHRRRTKQNHRQQEQ